MPRKTTKKQPIPAIALTLMVDGTPLLSVVSQTKVPLTGDKFTARTTVHPSARPSAIALTLAETARFLVEHDRLSVMLLDDVIARLTLLDTDWGDWEDALRERGGEDWPF